MSLSTDATNLSLKILSNLRIKDYENHLDDLQYTILLGLSRAYIKGRNQERDDLLYVELDDGSVYLNNDV